MYVYIKVFPHNSCSFELTLDNIRWTMHVANRIQILGVLSWTIYNNRLLILILEERCVNTIEILFFFSFDEHMATMNTIFVITMKVSFSPFRKILFMLEFRTDIWISLQCCALLTLFRYLDLVREVPQVAQ